MPRPKGRIKTETIKQRAIYVYLPSEEIVREWKDLAAEAKISISKFVFEHVQNSLAQEKEDNYVSRAQLIKQIKDLSEESSKLKEENRILRTAYERLDDELKHYRAQPFIEKQYEGIRVYEKELVRILKERKSVNSYELLDLLKIDPKDTEMVKATYKQLESLQAYGLVEETINGWRWIA